MKTCCSLLNAFVASALCTTANGQATFTPLGLTAAPGYSYAHDVSADGSIVIGMSKSGSGFQAFRWTATAGMEGLGPVPVDDQFSVANAISADGSVVVGDRRVSPTLSAAFRWTAAGGMVDLENPPIRSIAIGVSDDGSIVVGYRLSNAFRWTGTGGGELGVLPGHNESFAFDVSADGTVVVGSSEDDELDLAEAYRWTAAAGMVGIGDLAGGANKSVARSVSADGSVVVGHSTSANGAEAFRWTAATGMIGLGDLPGGDFVSEALSVSADGSVIVGRSETAVNGVSEAFYWTEALGIVNLRDVLASQGVANLAGWRLNEATGVSADGLIIVGTGTNPAGNTEAWVATIPEPSGLVLAAIALLLLTIYSRRALRSQRIGC